MYQNGRIYRLIDRITDKTIFIGSTTIKLSQKLAELKYNYHEHRSCAKYKDIFDKVGVDNIEIELIQSYPCNNIDELRMKEHEIKRSYINQPTNHIRQPLSRSVINQLKEMFN